MKLSFSTKGWHGLSFAEFCDAAQELGFEGIELHNVHNPLFTDKTAPFTPIPRRRRCAICMSASSN